MSDTITEYYRDKAVADAKAKAKAEKERWAKIRGTACLYAIDNLVKQLDCESLRKETWDAIAQVKKLFRYDERA